MICRSHIYFFQDQVVIRHLSSHDLHVRVRCTPTLKALPRSGWVQQKTLATSDPQAQTFASLFILYPLLYWCIWCSRDCNDMRAAPISARPVSILADRRAPVWVKEGVLWLIETLELSRTLGNFKKRLRDFKNLHQMQSWNKKKYKIYNIGNNNKNLRWNAACKKARSEWVPLALGFQFRQVTLSPCRKG